MEDVLTQQIEKCLKETFQLTRFRDGQLSVIRALLNGSNAAAIFPTGGGKSLCYQLPACLLSGTTVVVSPLLALMRDQVDRLVKLGVRAVRLDSSLTAKEHSDAMAALRSGQVKLLYVAPERFFNERFREVLADFPISLMAIDESHCISQWGHNFRPDYLKLSSVAKLLKVPRILALTATATPQVIEDIRKGFEIEEKNIICTPFYRPNLQIRFRVSNAKQRAKELLERLKLLPRGSTIIYVTTQKTSEEVAHWLAENGFASQAYHAGLEDDLRRQIQDWFMQEDNAIVVATIAFGMGIDKRDVRYVFHWNASKGIENFAQEIGRAGRDGVDSLCESWIVPEDRFTLENFAYADTPSHSSLDGLLDLIAHQPEVYYLSLYSLAYQFDIKDIVIRTILTYLELDGYIEGIGPRYDSYEFKPFVSSKEILSHFQGEYRTFVRDVLSLSVKKKLWFNLPISNISERLKCDRKQIISLMEHLVERGWVEVKVKGVLHGYRRLAPMGEPSLLAQEIFNKLEALERNEIRRIAQLFQLAVGAECQSKRLAEYFGQIDVENCGRCSACRGEAPSSFPEFNVARMGTSALTGLKQLTRDVPDVFDDPRRGAKFLCGLSSPLLSRKRMSSHPLYGCCSSVPFPTVLEAVSDII